MLLWLKKVDPKQKLRWYLGLFVLALIVPLFILSLSIYQQIENEMLYDYKWRAEEVVSRINQKLNSQLIREEN